MPKATIRTIWVISFCVLLGWSVFVAQAQGVNESAEFVLDFLGDEQDTQLLTTVDGEPQFYEVIVDGVAVTRFDATVVLRNAENLMGVNCDLVFEPSQLKVISIHEARGDLNFDGRSNIADVLVLGELFNQPLSSENGFSYFDRYAGDTSAGVVDFRDVESVLPFINQNNVYWTSNLNLDFSQVRESVEIFELPEVSNARGRIDDIVVVLLSRVHPVPAGFGFDGDARIADITFEIVGDISQGTTIQFEDRMAIDEGTVITDTEITNSSVPLAGNVQFTHP